MSAAAHDGTLSRKILDNRGYRGSVTIYFRLFRPRSAAGGFSFGLFRTSSMTVSGECYRRVTSSGGHCGVAKRLPRLARRGGECPHPLQGGAVEGRSLDPAGVPVRLRRPGLTFMLGLILTVTPARPAAAAQNPVVSGSGRRPPGWRDQAAGDVVSSAAVQTTAAAVSSVALRRSRRPPAAAAATAVQATRASAPRPAASPAPAPPHPGGHRSRPARVRAPQASSPLRPAPAAPAARPARRHRRPVPPWRPSPGRTRPPGTVALLTAPAARGREH